MDFVDSSTVNGRPFEEKINEWLSQTLKSSLTYPASTRTGRMVGSEMADQCVRKNQFRLNHTDRGEITGTPVISMESGKAVEELIKRNLLLNNPDSVLLWDSWIPKTKKMGLDYAGKLDLLLQFEDIPILVDIKTTSRIGEEKRVNIKDVERLLNEEDFLEKLNKTKGGIRKSPLKMDAYITQVMGYLTMTDLEYGAVFVFSRASENFYDDVTVDCEIVRATDKDKYNIIARMLLASRLNDSYQLAEKPSTYKKTTTCKYCDFTKFCYGGEDPGMQKLTKEESVAAYKNIYAEAVELYEQNRGTLAWIRDKKIEETAALKAVIANPSQENVQILLENYEMPVDEILFNVQTYYRKTDREQYQLPVNIIGRPK